MGPWLVSPCLHAVCAVVPVSQQRFICCAARVRGAQRSRPSEIRAFTTPFLSFLDKQIIAGPYGRALPAHGRYLCSPTVPISGHFVMPYARSFAPQPLCSPWQLSPNSCSSPQRADVLPSL